MKRRLSPFARTALLLCVALVGAASGARAQSVEEPELPAVTVAQKIDEFGKVGHCDLTARLDNFAIYLQSEPQLKGYILINEMSVETASRSSWRLKLAHRYLVDQRNIDPARLVSVTTGKQAADNALTELWVAPVGAPLPFSLPEPPDAAKEFSGKIDSYQTDESFEGEVSEMGPSLAEYAMGEFVEKLNNQPQSKGYLRIRTPAQGLPGGWRRIARRDVRLLQTQFGLDPPRLKAVDGGYTDDDRAEVELWILPHDAPPPPGPAEKLSPRLTEPANLDYLELGGEPDEERVDWSLENLAEQLREDPHARACIIARRYEPPAEAEDAAEPTRKAEDAETVEAADPFAVAEEWKKRLVEKHGVGAHRLFVMVGRPQEWEGGSVQTWLVPADAPLPDPFVVTEDVEEVVTDEETGGETEDADAPTQPPPARIN